MREEDRKRLKKESLILIKNLDVGGVNDYLFRDDILDDEHLELIEGQITTKGKVRQLLKILRNHHSDDVFKKFCSAIRESGEENEYLADALENADITGMEDVGLDEPDFNANELKTQIIRHYDVMLNMREQHQRELNAMRKRFESMEEPSTRRNSTEWSLKDSVDGAGFEDKNVRAYVAKLCTNPSPINSEPNVPPAVNLFPSDLWTSRRRVVPPPPMSVEDEACYLGVDIVRFVLFNKGILRLDKMPAAERPAAEVLRKMILELNKNNVFDILLQQLDSTELDGFSTFKAIGDEIFNEVTGEYSWGRVAAWYAFWAHVATSLPAERAHETVNIFGNYIGFYLAQHLTEWITSHGGWEGFVQYGRISPPNNSWHWRSGVMKLLGFIGYIPWRVMLEQYPHRP